MPKRSRVTIRTIAAHVGLGKSAVAYILSGKGPEHSIPEETIERVKQAADELSYRPNAHARSISTGKFEAVSFIVRHNVSYMPLDLLFGVYRGLEEHDLKMVFTEMPSNDALQEDRLPRILRELSVDGLLIDFIAEEAQLIQDLFERYQIPAVWLNAKNRSDCVHPDDYQGANLATQYLLGEGHRDILFAGPENSRHYSRTDRYAGYAQAMREAGLTPREVLSNTPRQENKWRRRELLNRDLAQAALADEPTAVITHNPYEAGPILTHAHDLGLSIPDDLTVVTFHDRPLNDHPDFVALLEIPMLKVGRTGVDMLTAKINDGKTHPPEAIPYELTKNFTENIASLD